MGDAYDDYENRALWGYWNTYTLTRSSPKLAMAKQRPEYKPAAEHVFGKHKEKAGMAIYKYKNAEGTEVYGKRLVIDGMQWVMKEVGTGTIHAVSPKAVTEVLPYTVAVKFLSDNKTTATTYQYVAKEGDVAVGDLLWIASSTGLAHVVAVDTKAKSATRSLSGWKLSGTPLTEVVTDDE